MQQHDQLFDCHLGHVAIKKGALLHEEALLLVPQLLNSKFTLSQ